MGPGYVRRGELDALLRAIHRGGPRITNMDRLRDEDFARAWHDWPGLEDEEP
jgi:hypothetical protein